MQAYLRDRTVVVLLPARMSKAEERFWVAEMVDRLERQEQRRARRANRSDTDLFVRARQLSRRYLDARAEPIEVRWVTNQNDRWGSCTPAQRTIRLSARLQQLPSWVADYVLVHELAHLLEDGHGPAFWALVNRYPRAERARGYLQGVAAAAGLSMVADEPDPADLPPAVIEPVAEPAAAGDRHRAARAGRRPGRRTADGQSGLW